LDSVKLDSVNLESVNLESENLESEQLDVNLENVDLTSEKDYSKLTIKQLKELLSEKGINATKMKKNEMIDLIEKSSTTINESE
jgi:hypothetical protein